MNLVDTRFRSSATHNWSSGGAGSLTETLEDLGVEDDTSVLASLGNARLGFAPDAVGRRRREERKYEDGEDRGDDRHVAPHGNHGLHVEA